MGKEAAPGRKVVRPKGKSSASKAVFKDALDSGNQVELSITAEVKKGGRSFWVKGGATVTVRPGEDGEDAKDRLSEFVIRMVDDQINEYLG